MSERRQKYQGTSARALLPPIRASGRQPSEIAEEVGQYLVEPAHPYPEQVADLVLRELGDLEARYAERGRSLSELCPPEELAERMVATVPLPSPWGELGPFYSTGKVARLLGGISRQAIADRRKRGTLLGLQTIDGVGLSRVPVRRPPRRSRRLVDSLENLEIERSRRLVPRRLVDVTDAVTR